MINSEILDIAVPSTLQQPPKKKYKRSKSPSKGKGKGKGKSSKNKYFCGKCNIEYKKEKIGYSGMTVIYGIIGCVLDSKVMKCGIMYKEQTSNGCVINVNN